MGRTLIGLVVVLAFAAVLGTFGWFYAKDRIRSQQQYRLSADKISVTPPPHWVSDRFVEEVLRSSGLNQTGSLLDKTLPQKLTEAFAAYPWVEKVEQVVPRYPSGAEVKLLYRVPMALVEVSRLGTLPVDRNGILLPQEYLVDTLADRWSQHLVIQGIQSTPLGAVGTPWGDPLVQTAAQLAAELSDITEPLQLAQITPAMETSPSGARIVWRLKTVAGTEIRWGAFPSDNPDTETKIKKLLKRHEDFRSLDNIPANLQPVDVSRE